MIGTDPHFKVLRFSDTQPKRNFFYHKNGICLLYKWNEILKKSWYSWIFSYCKLNIQVEIKFKKTLFQCIGSSDPFPYVVQPQSQSFHWITYRNIYTRRLIKFGYIKRRSMVRIKKNPDNLELSNMAKDQRAFNTECIVTVLECADPYICSGRGLNFVFLDSRSPWPLIFRSANVIDNPC